MRVLDRFLHLPSEDRGLLMESALLLGAIRLGLWLLPFRTLRHLLGRISHAKVDPSTADHVAVGRVGWAVTTASRRILGTKCLAQALAMQVLTARRGHPACLRIGVVQGKVGQLEAHTWVESDGWIVLGGDGDVERYAPLRPPEEDRIG